MADGDLAAMCDNAFMYVNNLRTADLDMAA